ncbi:hypothetical protein AUP68_16501 [Ilyonectria robusta]
MFVAPPWRTVNVGSDSNRCLECLGHVGYRDLIHSLKSLISNMKISILLNGLYTCRTYACKDIGRASYHSCSVNHTKPK